MKIKVDDIVEIVGKSYFDERLKGSGMLCVDADTIRDMKKYSGKITQVKKIDKDGFVLDIDDGNFIWSEFEIVKFEKETSLYSDANTLCNNLDREIIKLTKECVGSSCIFYEKEEKKIDIFTKMHNINKSFEYVAKARALLRGIK